MSANKKNETTKKKAIRGWVMYDWANSAFATTVMAAVLPIFYSDVAGKGLSSSQATSYWGYTQAISMLFVAILAPILGAISDYSKSKMKFLKFFVFIGTMATTLLFFVNTGDYILCSILFIIGTIGFSGGNVFYDSLLPLITERNEIDYISSKGYAFGYLGGGLLLLLNLAMIEFPNLFFIQDALLATKIVFVTVAIWWFVFSIPLFRNVKDEDKGQPKGDSSYIAIGFNRIINTFKEIKKYRQLFKFIIAFWLYNDGIGTIIRMATIYGREIGIGQTHLIGALLLTQFVGIPFSILFGKIAGKIGTKRSIYAALTIYVFIVSWGYFLDSALDFWILAFFVGTVQGGSQALSRSLFGSMVPKSKSAEFFGFLGISSKFAAMFGPFVFALVGQITGSSRYGIISLILFFGLGMFILSKVDEEEGRSIAQEG